MGKIFKFCIGILREDSAFPLKISYLEICFDVTRTAGGHTRHADGDHTRLVNLGPLALVNKCRLTNSSGKEIERINRAHVFCLIYKLISSSRDGDDLSIGFREKFETRAKND